jgi:hypothetical protein
VTCVCCVCRVACGHNLHGFAVEALCAKHADWLDDEISAVPETLTYDGDGGHHIDRDVWDEWVMRARESDEEERTGPVMTVDPLDGLSLYGVGGAA